MTSPARISSGPTAEGGCRGALHARRGFTLLELGTVMVVLAIAGAALAFRVGAPLRRVQLDQTLSRLEDLDRLARATARRTGRAVELAVDPAAGRVTSRVPGSDARRTQRVAALASGLTIGRCAASGRAPYRGPLRVTIAAEGQSESYAVRLDSPRGPATWLLVLGGSGQCVRTADERLVQRGLGRP